MSINDKARNLAAMAPELLDGVKQCLNAEKARQKKLKPNSPASSYTAARIEHLEHLIACADGGVEPYKCRSCGRLEGDCSIAPCEAVIADRAS